MRCIAGSTLALGLPRSLAKRRVCDAVQKLINVIKQESEFIAGCSGPVLYTCSLLRRCNMCARLDLPILSRSFPPDVPESSQQLPRHIHLVQVFDVKAFTVRVVLFPIHCAVCTAAVLPAMHP